MDKNKYNMSGLRLTPEEHKQIQEAFQGGYTHANMWKSEKIFKDVIAIDPVICLYPIFINGGKYEKYDK